MTNRFLFVLAAVLLTARPLFAQVPAPNAAGVSAGHEHFRAVDLEAADRFWVALGGVHTSLGKRQVVKFPGVIVMVARATPEAPVTGGTEGSTIDMIRFRVKNLKHTLSALAAAGYKPLPNSGAQRAYVTGPHEAKVQLVEDPSLSTPVATDALVMKVPNPAEAAAWYAKWFGAKVVTQGKDTYAEIPGMDLRFEATTKPLAGTRGRALDHMGLEVKNLEAFMKKLADGGVKIDRPFSPPPPDVMPPLKSLAYVSDPWGTSIELNEGFSEVK
jgi:catechol 2,3-dioxygenase-like lactoylglutathione lyase family enzyme